MDRYDELESKYNAGTIGSQIASTLGTTALTTGIKLAGTAAATAGSTAAGTAAAGAGIAAAVPVAGWIIGGLMAIGSGIVMATKAGERKRQIADIQANEGIAAIDGARKEAAGKFGLDMLEAEAQMDFNIKESEKMRNKLKEQSEKKKRKVKSAAESMKADAILGRSKRSTEYNEAHKDRRISEFEVL